MIRYYLRAGKYRLDQWPNSAEGRGRVARGENTLAALEAWRPSVVALASIFTADVDCQQMSPESLIS
jgi:hypothetical protein